MTIKGRIKLPSHLPAGEQEIHQASVQWNRDTHDEMKLAIGIKTEASGNGGYLSMFLDADSARTLAAEIHKVLPQKY